MKKLSNQSDVIPSEIFLKLLAERKMPLSESRQNAVLEELGRQTASSEFLLYCRVRDEHSNDTEVTADQILETAFLIADNAKLLPVFSSTDFLYPALDRQIDFSPYAADLIDLITFLDCNPAVEAAVLNPGEDDLILSKELMIFLLQKYGTGKEQTILPQ